jgi:hypothetical protein
MSTAVRARPLTAAPRRSRDALRLPARVLDADLLHVAVLAEYDGLPGIGHSCGHNTICATAVGGLVAAAPVQERVDGRVSLIGTPAEEAAAATVTVPLRQVSDRQNRAMFSP